MGKVRLRESVQVGENGTESAPSVLVKPLRVSGVVVAKADLIAALRLYVPALCDVQVTEDGQQFWLLLNEGGGDAGSTAR